ncbi:FAD-binding oxidoreductase [Paralimibaculum aggregatum]|uniref:FAD-binding oxidoreductase n=1 Tax=Paralimibaculum aggregatum TaxID=3036245 RepID=A0ABQ6LN95_9RHOB|nr:FAD-dependent oxidoreductase [Limibaculum sp. NKW23]GMG84648.1 FAD-binding oxidoreductase [Limibaculum sp. NKW23]
MRIAVLGAGITGVATAEWLRRDGHEVELIDRIEPGDPRQTSFGNAGILAANAVVPVPVPGLLAKAPRMLLDPDGPLFLRWSYLPRLLPWLTRFLAHGRLAEVERISRMLGALVLDSVDQHRRLAEGTGAERHIGDGHYTFLYPDRAAWEKDKLGNRLRQEAGIRCETLDRAALTAADPELGPDYGFAATFRDSGNVTDPGAYTAALFAHFIREGGRFRRAEVEDVRPDGEGVMIRAGGEEIAADRAVLAMGAWSGRLAERLGHRAGMESERGYHLMLENPSHMPPGPYMLTDRKCAASPMEGGLRLAGLAEFGGLAAGPSAAPTALQRRAVRRLYPRLTWEGESVWLGHRPSTVDSLPMLGQAPKAPGVYFAFGAQHLGLTMAPKTGRLIADMIAGRPPNIDLADCRVGRFD